MQNASGRGVFLRQVQWLDQVIEGARVIENALRIYDDEWLEPSVGYSVEGRSQWAALRTELCEFAKGCGTRWEKPSKIV